MNNAYRRLGYLKKQKKEQEKAMEILKPKEAIKKKLNEKEKHRDDLMKIYAREYEKHYAKGDTDEKSHKKGEKLIKKIDKSKKAKSKRKIKYNVVIKKSNSKNKKYMALINGKNKVHFGGVRANKKPYEDYTTHKDKERKKRYIQRHKKEVWTLKKGITPAFLSRWVLWEEPSLKKAIQKLNKKYKSLHVKLNV